MLDCVWIFHDIRFNFFKVILSLFNETKEFPFKCLTWNGNSTGANVREKKSEHKG